MKIELTKTKCTVTREPDDPKYYGAVNAAGESKLLYAIKNQLNQKGLGLIKKRMWKDGHLVDDMQQYLRNRDGSIAIFNPRWAIEGAEVDFNNGQVKLTVVDLTTNY